MNGWKHWCKGNTKDCAQLTADDILPGSLLSNNKTALAGLKVLSYIVGTWNFVNTTSNDGTGTSATTGTITFKDGGYDQNSGSSASFIETTNGKIVHAIIDCDIINGKTVCRSIGNTSGVWTSDGEDSNMDWWKW